MAATPDRSHKSTYVVVLMLFSLLIVAVVGAQAARSYDGKSYVPEGGVDAINGPIRVNDVWLDAPTGARSGSDAGVRLQLVNDSNHRDALTGVSTPVAARVQLMLHGQPVGRIRLAPWSARDLEWSRHRHTVELVDVTRSLRPGQWFPITFRFEHSRPITVRISTGPLGGGAARR